MLRRQRNSLLPWRKLLVLIREFSHSCLSRARKVDTVFVTVLLLSDLASVAAPLIAPYPHTVLLVVSVVSPLMSPPSLPMILTTPTPRRSCQSQTPASPATPCPSRPKMISSMSSLPWRLNLICLDRYVGIHVFHTKFVSTFSNASLADCNRFKDFFPGQLLLNLKWILWRSLLPTWKIEDENLKL